MARWEPDAGGRLVEAAMELFQERGFDLTTVADIAARAGLTERTFFRYFTDKREVLFAGSHILREHLVNEVASASPRTAPIDAVVGALERATSFFEDRRDFARKRHALIVAHEELQERELIKLASLAMALGAALRRRGTPPLAASLAAEAGITIFKHAFESWLTDARSRELTHHLRAARGELEKVTAAKRPPRAASQRR
jgi:AcrR family transcriptional regulator